MKKIRSCNSWAWIHWVTHSYSNCIKKNSVHGVDINKNVVNTINKGEIHIIEPELDKVVKLAVQKGFLKASNQAVKANTYVIVVPTPFKEKNEPDVSYIQDATDKIIPLLKPGDLYIVESTSPIGTTEKMMSLIFNKRPELKNKICIAYCPREFFLEM